MLNRRRREGRWMESAEVESSESCPSYSPLPFHLLSTHLTDPCLKMGQCLEIKEFGWKYRQFAGNLQGPN